MTTDALVVLLQAHFKSRGIAFVHDVSNDRLDGLDEASAFIELAALIHDVMPESWEDAITREIPVTELSALRAEAEAR